MPLANTTPNQRLTLPTPPSTNQLYSGRRYKTPRYDAWITEAGWELKRQRAQPIRGPFALTIYLPGQADIDNIKAIPDLLKKMGLIEDDRRKFMRRIVVETTSGPCEIVVEPWVGGNT